MKNGVVTVFKKETARFFGDRRLLFTAVIMPGLLIYLIYSFMGTSMSSMIEDKTSSYSAVAVNMPSDVASSLKEMDFEIENISQSGVEDAKQKIKDGDCAACVVFPENFESVLSDYAEGEKPKDTPNVEIYYNSAEINSANAYSCVVTVLDGIETQVSNVFDVNNAEGETQYDLATEKDAAGTIFSMVLPMIIMMMLYSSCVAIAPESIAGEKERGTLAALLITPVPRSQIILGKVLALSVMSLLGGLSSFLGTILSLPKLMGSMGGEELISADVYGVFEYICLIVLILTTVLLLITLISIISTLAKSVKEAGTLVLPLMLVVMMMCVLTMYNSDSSTEIYWYFIPLFNTVQSMTQVFSFSAAPVNIAVTCVSNIVFSAAGIFVLTKLFNSEKVMFNS